MRDIRDPGEDARQSMQSMRVVRCVRGAGAIALLWLALLAAACATGSAGSAGSGRSDEVRVLVFNIHAGKDARGVDNLERVAALARETGADLALLQEVDVRTQRSGGVDQPAVLASLTGFSAAFGRTLDYQGGLYGIAVLSRWPILRDTMLQLPVSPPQGRAGGSYEPRGALIATVGTPRGPITVINTHLDASGDEHYRLQELATLIAEAGRARETSALLMGGDFNARPDSEVIRRARAAGWQDAWAACGSGDGHTFPADSAVRRIDYLFLVAGADCTEALVVGHGVSDHLGVLVTVRLR